MPLHGPFPDDIKKIHAEINQIVNQRFLLSTLAITVFGGMLAWIIQKEPPEPYTVIEPIIYLWSCLVIIVLFGIFFLMMHLAKMLRIFSTYLIITNSSNWEKDWAKYKDRYNKDRYNRKNYFGYTKPQTLIFVLLGSISAIPPIIIKNIYCLYENPFWEILTIVLLFFYLLFVCGMGFRGWFSNEKDIERNWKNLNNP